MTSLTHWMLIVLNSGVKEKNFDLNKYWFYLIPDDKSRANNDQCKRKTISLFRECQQDLENLEMQIKTKNKGRAIPYDCCCVSQLQSSACL
mmetsp:Transcript_46909/g.77886  ORF Transcript_46909/g.77886 Transcript_46909/m.77886 type:complete len:91 (-) Transcript_46909:33-305(-)